jgi:hypothetical protein
MVLMKFGWKRTVVRWNGMERKGGKGRNKRKDCNDEKHEHIETRPNTIARARKQRAIDIPIFPFSAGVKQFGCQYQTGRNSPDILFTAQGWQTFLLDEGKRGKVTGMHARHYHAA